MKDNPLSFVKKSHRKKETQTNKRDNKFKLELISHPLDSFPFTQGAKYYNEKVRISTVWCGVVDVHPFIHIISSASLEIPPPSRFYTIPENHCCNHDEEERWNRKSFSFSGGRVKNWLHFSEVDIEIFSSRNSLLSALVIMDLSDYLFLLHFMEIFPFIFLCIFFSQFSQFKSFGLALFFHLSVLFFCLLQFYCVRSLWFPGKWSFLFGYVV